MSLGTIGVPVALWIRYRLRGPLVLLWLILLFWHVLVYVPPIATDEADAPGFLFVFMFAPMYVVVYLLIAGVEFGVRK